MPPAASLRFARANVCCVASVTLRGAAKVMYLLREEDNEVGEFESTCLKSENSHEHSLALMLLILQGAFRR